ncbi:MAG: PilZ domain-containing protein [Myxococcales bacterium]|jgi:hypothetical protein
MLEARQYTRAPVALTPRYRPATAVDFAEVKCHDLSVGGMFLEADRTIEPGTLVKVQCDLPAGAISGLGVVVWRRDACSERGPAGVGVRFMRLADGGPELIEAFVSERVSGTPPARETPRAAEAAPTPQTAGDDPAEDLQLPVRRGGRALVAGAALLLAAILFWALR